MLEQGRWCHLRRGLSKVGLSVSCIGRHNCLQLTNLLICGCKTSLALTQQTVREACYFIPLWIGWLSRSSSHFWCSEGKWFWSSFWLAVARVAKLLLFNTKFKTWSCSCAAPFMRRFVLNSELLRALMKVLNLTFNVFSLKRDSLTCRVYYASCCLLLHLDRSQVQEVNRFEIGSIYWDSLLALAAAQNYSLQLFSISYLSLEPANIYVCVCA